MTFYILMNHITTLFVSVGLLTTLSFDSEITSYMYGGSKEDLFLKVTNNHKTLAIKPKVEGVASNLLVVTKNRKYYFDLRYSKDKPHQFVEVKDGVINHSMTMILEGTNEDILEGESSVLVINKSRRPIQINGKKFKNKKYFSKGIPLIKGDQRIFN